MFNYLKKDIHPAAISIPQRRPMLSGVEAEIGGC